jgi:hypothetical protein
MDRLLDVLLTTVHCLIIGFNLLGWVWKPLRRAHLICIGITAACWFILGIWYGIGYCPVTDWQWHIKEQLGEHNLPASFITYYADKITGKQIDETLISNITAVSFFVAAGISVYVNFFRRHKK